MEEYMEKVRKDWTEWRNQEGKLHRLDGPAMKNMDGYRSWWVNGKQHRLDGPAVEYEDGDREWWIDGIEYSEEDFDKKVKEIKLNEV